MSGLNILPPLEQGDILLVDGGMSTQLSRYVPGVDEDPLWTARSVVEHPDKVLQCHQDFIQAGSRILIAASYQISEEGFKKYLDKDAEATRSAVKKSVELAKSAVKKCGLPDSHILVGGSVGPYGACQHDGSEYTGDYIKESKVTREELMSWHKLRIGALIEAGADFLAIETQPTWQEVLAILDLVLEMDPTIPVWVTFTIKDDTYLASGDLIKDAFNHVIRHAMYAKGRIFAFGFNCCAPSAVTGALDIVRSVNKTLPLVVYPNTGEEWDGKERCWKGKPQDWEECVGEWLKRGAILLGGCCRVDCDQITKIRVAMAKALLKQLK